MSDLFDIAKFDSLFMCLQRKERKSRYILTMIYLEALTGEIMKGKISPEKCPLFGNRCTPDTPLGASMVSSEGACSAFYRYRTN